MFLFQTNVSIATSRSLPKNLELLIELIKRDLKSRYKNTALGALWVILQPLTFAIVFIILNKFLIKWLPIKYDYVLMFGVLIPWQFFISTFQRSTDSILVNDNLICRVKFPLILLPMSVVISALFDGFLNLIVLFAFMFFLKGVVFTGVLSLFFVLVISGIFTLALGVVFSLLVSFLADLRHLVSFINRISIFILPVFYSIETIPENFRLFYENIPLVWMITASKEMLSGFYNFFSLSTLSVFLVSLISMFVAYLIFKRMENFVIDYI